MKAISIYDAEAEKLEELAEKYNTSVAEIMEAALIALDEAYTEDSWDEEYV